MLSSLCALGSFSSYCLLLVESSVVSSQIMSDCILLQSKSVLKHKCLMRIMTWRNHYESYFGISGLCKRNYSNPVLDIKKAPFFVLIFENQYFFIWQPLTVPKQYFMFYVD